MNRMNEEVAWLRLQDMQREAENRRLVAGSRRSAAMAMLKGLLARSDGADRGQAVEPRQELA